LLARHKENLEMRVEERTAELAEANTSLRRSEATLRAIHDITTDPDTKFDRKLESLLCEGCRFFRMEFAAIADSADKISCRINVGSESDPEQLGRIAELLQIEIEGTCDPVAISDLAQHAFSSKATRTGALAGSAIGTSFQVDDEVAGFILFCSEQPGARLFSDVDIDILQLMAQWLGGEIERNEINRRAQEHQAHLAHVARLNTMGEMATGIAHELNQPLTAILNYSSGGLRLLQKQGNDTEANAAFANIGNDARRAADIIKRLREFIKRGEHRPEQFRLRDCIEPAVELLHPRLVQHGIDVRIKYAPDITDIVADRIQIEQVVVNLLLNAIDALQPLDQQSKKISIDVAGTEAGEISVSVSDTGGGLNEGVVKNVFDPFFTTKTEGMGMGLSISRSIVEAHGGSIEYLLNDQQQPTFRFTLPPA
jgi:C4-dicarboxylate-specific signal transduction histidine kinase